jgi:hypothetical protein
VSQCTVAKGSRVWTFDPASPASVSQTEVDGDVSSVACPALSQCTALGNFDLGLGQVWTFDPAMPSTGTGFALPLGTDEPLAAVGPLACPTVSQCTSVGELGEESTFDPQATEEAPEEEPTEEEPTEEEPTEEVTPDVSVTPNVTTTDIDGLEQLVALACPSEIQCTAIDQGGREVTFNPQSPGSPTPVALGAEYSLSGLACPSVKQCTASAWKGRR